MHMLQLSETQKAMVVAGLAGTDLRTVKKALRGEPVRPAALERIELAKRQLAQLQSSPVPVVQG
jgi:hypothetical protein